MFNPKTQTFDDPKGFVKAMRTAFPDVKISPPQSESTGCDVCEGGALLLYSVRQGYVKADDLMAYINEGTDEESGVFDQRPDDDGAINSEWRFPVPQVLEIVLVGLNPRLREREEVVSMAAAIIEANDAGDFEKSEALIEQALVWPNA